MEEDLAKKFHDLRHSLRNFRKEMDEVYNEVVGKNLGVSGEKAGRTSNFSAKMAESIE
jgi:hypothetical protein